MRVTDDFKCPSTKAPQGPLELHTTTLLALPISCHHTVRSVAQEAYRTLWATEPDRAERWRRVSNMDQVFGIGRPLETISKQALVAAYREMEETGLSEEVIDQHFDDFRCLMLWADDWGFVEWSRPSEADGEGAVGISDEPTPQDYYDLIGCTVRDMMREGKAVRSDAGDEALRRFAFYLRDALGLEQPPRH